MRRAVLLDLDHATGELLTGYEREYLEIYCGAQTYLRRQP